MTVPPIKEKMQKNYLWWFGHVQRRPTDALVQWVEFINVVQVKKRRNDENKDRGDTKKLCMLEA